MFCREYYCQSYNLQQTGTSTVVLTLYEADTSTKNQKQKKPHQLHILSKKECSFQVADSGLKLSELPGHLASFFQTSDVE